MGHSDSIFSKWRSVLISCQRIGNAVGRCQHNVRGFHHIRRIRLQRTIAATQGMKISCNFFLQLHGFPA